MDCQRCGRPATVHVTQVVAHQRKEVRLCDACAKAADLLPAGHGDLNLPALVSLLMGLPAAAAGLACPDCGTTYGTFRADGRLGCPTEYDAFRPALEPLLVRIHRRAEHCGKRPKAAGRRADAARMTEELAAAVAAERYDEAARLRDRLRAALGSGDGPG
jgi:protein arginine kinase activator